MVNRLMMMEVNVDERGFQVLLTGVSQLLFSPSSGSSGSAGYGIPVKEPDYIVLKGKLVRHHQARLSDDQISHDILLVESILSRAALESWTTATLQDFLEKKALSGEYIHIFTTFWTREATKVRTEYTKTYYYLLLRVNAL